MKEKNEKPILFSSAMVRAILDGNKTQTRRVINKVPSHYEFSARLSSNENLYRFWCKDELKSGIDNRSSGIIDVKCPYGKIGTKLWVRETWAEIDFWQGDVKVHEINGKNYIYRQENPDFVWLDGDGGYEHRANGEEVSKWKPSIFMPREASRITLEITNIRVERLRDITADGVMAEGVKTRPFCDCGSCSWESPYVSFQNLWNSINAKRGFGWDANPYVFVIEFKKV